VIVGTAFVVSVVIVTVVDDGLLANFVVPGDRAALARDMAAEPRIFRLASALYLLVLMLDAIIGLALYVVLRPAGRRLAMAAGGLRLLYAGMLMIGVLGLALRWLGIDGFAAIKDAGYVVFALHILVLGYAVFRSGYIPKLLGAMLIVAAVTYSIFFVDMPLPSGAAVLAMLTMAGAELALSLWLLVKRNSLPDVTPRAL